MQRVLSSEIMAEYRTPGMFNTNGIWQIGPMIITWGTDEQKARWLPSILEAHDHWCQGFSEPQAGNDLANLRTTAILDGDHYVVNGQKIWISTAHLAKWGLFLLRTDPTAIERGVKHEGITAFILDMETPGIECRPIKDMAGEEMFNEIFFTDARVPVDCRLGDEGLGWMVAMGTLGLVQKQILRLIRSLQERHGTSVLFVSHDLGVVAKICDRVTVLYMGKVVEQGVTADVLNAPRHAYTKALLAANPRYDRPDLGLEPTPPEVVAALRAEIAAFDASVTGPQNG